MTTTAATGIRSFKILIPQLVYGDFFDSIDHNPTFKLCGVNWNIELADSFARWQK
jgi:hypothetical protein